MRIFFFAMIMIALFLALFWGATNNQILCNIENRRLWVSSFYASAILSEEIQYSNSNGIYSPSLIIFYLDSGKMIVCRLDDSQCFVANHIGG